MTLASREGFSVSNSNSARPLFSARLEEAARFAAVAHREQTRKLTDTPYFQHPAAVAWILDRAGFGEDVVIAGLLHDVVEDAEISAEEIKARFGPAVAALVVWCSEVKTDAEGRKRPWIDRKRDHLAALENAPVEARAVVLADKLHNLASIAFDLDRDLDVWNAFNADRERVFWYYETTLERCGRGDPRLERLAAECRERLDELKI